MTAERAHRPLQTATRGFPWLLSALFLLGALPPLWRVAVNLAVHLRFEDSLIVLRYARNLVDGYGFVFNPGERVLGVTTPLQTGLAALAVWLARDHALSIVNVLGVAWLGLESLMAALIVRRFCGAPAAVLAGVVILNNLNLNYLYFGMEVHLFAFLALLALWLFLEERETAAGIVLGVAFLTRFDAALLALLIGAVLTLERRRPPWRLAVPFIAIGTPWLVFSGLYFGSLLPNTLAAKEGAVGFASYVHRSAVYYKRTFEVLVASFTDSSAAQDLIAWILPAFIALGAWMVVARERRALLLVVYPALHFLVYAVIGADPAFVWHFYILNPLLFMMLAIGLDSAVRRGSERLLGERTVRGRAPARLAAAVVVALLTVPLAWRLWTTSHYRYELDPPTRDLYRVAAWLDKRYGPETTLLNPSIGVLGWETELRIIDQAGLVTEGLYYFDSEQYTPIAEVMRRFSPDLVLVMAGHHPELADYGYRVVKQFDGSVRYLLYSRQGDRR